MDRARMRLLLLTMVASASARFAVPVANSSSGSFAGYQMLSSDGRTFWAFSGIRFAQPPIGRLRFQPPVPIEPSDGLQNALEEGNQCIQVNPLVKPQVISGSEDCLFLNVYTHDIDRQVPVMVWIHGGGWRFGSGSKSSYGPDFLMNEDIVLVSFNYRLGPLGFGSFENEMFPGNMGLKDQEEAIRWVKQNIDAFGGDPNQITIFGQSAGAASVNYHLKGRIAGLIHKGIAQSGSSLSPWAIGRKKSVRKITMNVAQLAGCNIEEVDAVIYECLMNKGAEELINAVKDLPIVDQETLPFRPVIEPNGPVPVDPWDLPPATVPLLTGQTTAEGAFLAAIFLKGGEFFLTLIDKAFNRLVPDLLMFRDTAKDPEAIATKIREYYFGDRNISKAEVESVIAVTTDAWFSHPIHAEIEKHNGSVYSYLFDYNGSRTISDILNVTKEYRFGPAHVDDIPYIFRAELLDLLAEGSFEDLIKSKEMVKIWTNFAKGLDPTPEKVLGDNWERKSHDGGHLVISNGPYSIVSRENDNSWLRQRLNFWAQLPLRG